MLRPAPVDGADDVAESRLRERLACIRDTCPLCALGHELVYSSALRTRGGLGAWAGLGHHTPNGLQRCRAARIWVRHAAEGLPGPPASRGTSEAALTAFQFEEHERALSPGGEIRPLPTSRVPLH